MESLLYGRNRSIVVSPVTPFKASAKPSRTVIWRIVLSCMMIVAISAVPRPTLAQNHHDLVKVPIITNWTGVTGAIFLTEGHESNGGWLSSGYFLCTTNGDSFGQTSKVTVIEDREHKLTVTRNVPGGQQVGTLDQYSAEEKRGGGIYDVWRGHTTGLGGGHDAAVFLFLKPE